MRLTLPILALTLALAASGCRKAKVKDAADEMPYPEAPASVEAAGLFGSLTGACTPWQQVYMPVTVALEAPESMSISGRAYMVRDSLVHISLRALGMEVAVVHADADSVYLVDKYHKMYIAESLPGITGDTGLTIGNVQDLLLGRPFAPGGGTLMEADATACWMERHGREFDFAPADSPAAGIDWMYTAWACEPAVLRNLYIYSPGSDDDAPPAATATYSGASSTPAGETPAAISLDAGAVKASLRWNTSEARWDQPRDEKFTPPSPGGKYQRIDARAMLRSASAL